MSRYLAPVYSSLSLGEICSAAAVIGMGEGAEVIERARAAVASEYPGYGVLLTDSGTSALALSIELALSRSGREEERALVAAPAFACPDVGAAAVAANARLMLYDLDPFSLEPQWSGIERALRAGARVVILSHLYGRVLDAQPAHELASLYGAMLVEDAAQHAGGSCKNVRGGAQCTLGVLSFGRGKGINAGGGGALLHRLEDSWTIPELSRDGAGLARLVKAAVVDTLSHPRLYGLPARVPALAIGQTIYRQPERRASIPTALASLLIASLGKENRERTVRRANERVYYSRLSSNSSPTVQLLSPHEESGALRTPVLIREPSQDQKTALSALGVVRSYPRTLFGYRELASYIANADEKLVGSMQLAAELYTMPTHSWVRISDIEHICRLLSQ